jgi:hypothetical protein
MWLIAYYGVLCIIWRSFAFLVNNINIFQNHSDILSFNWNEWIQVGNPNRSFPKKTEVEELKILSRIMSVLLTTIIFNTASLTTFTCLCVFILATTKFSCQWWVGSLDWCAVCFLLHFRVSCILVERIRLDIAKKGDLIHNRAAVPMRVMWLV